MIKVLFMGRKKVAAQALEYVLQNKNVQVVAVLTDSHLEISPTTDVASKNGIPCLNFEQALQSMKDGTLSFDLGLSVLYWRKLKEGFISIPSLGTINFHPAPLPEYKGTAGYNLAIMDELEQWAATAHYVDENIDTGEIIKVKSFDIQHAIETAYSLEKKSQPVLLELFKEVFDSAVAMRAKLIGYPNIGGRYVSRPEMEAMKEVTDGDDVNKKIRAFWFPPYPGAFKMVNGVKCTLVNDFVLSQLSDPDVSNLFTQPSFVKA